MIIKIYSAASMYRATSISPLQLKKVQKMNVMTEKGFLIQLINDGRKVYYLFRGTNIYNCVNEIENEN
jgi:hypothetical protein